MQQPFVPLRHLRARPSSTSSGRLAIMNHRQSLSDLVSHRDTNPGGRLKGLRRNATLSVGSASGIDHGHKFRDLPIIGARDLSSMSLKRRQVSASLLDRRSLPLAAQSTLDLRTLPSADDLNNNLKVSGFLYPSTPDVRSLTPSAARDICPVFVTTDQRSPVDLPFDESPSKGNVHLVRERFIPERRTPRLGRILISPTDQSDDECPTSLPPPCPLDVATSDSSKSSTIQPPLSPDVGYASLPDIEEIKGELSPSISGAFDIECLLGELPETDIDSPYEGGVTVTSSTRMEDDVFQEVVGTPGPDFRRGVDTSERDDGFLDRYNSDDNGAFEVESNKEVSDIIRERDSANESRISAEKVNVFEADAVERYIVNAIEEDDDQEVNVISEIADMMTIFGNSVTAEVKTLSELSEAALLDADDEEADEEDAPQLVRLESYEMRAIDEFRTFAKSMESMTDQFEDEPLTICPSGGNISFDEFSKFDLMSEYSDDEDEVANKCEVLAVCSAVSIAEIHDENALDELPMSTRLDDPSTNPNEFENEAANSSSVADALSCVEVASGYRTSDSTADDIPAECSLSVNSKQGNAMNVDNITDDNDDVTLPQKVETSNNSADDDTTNEITSKDTTRVSGRRSPILEHGGETRHSESLQRKIDRYLHTSTRSRVAEPTNRIFTFDNVSNG